MEMRRTKARSEANSLNNKMCKLETGICAVFWHDIIDRVNATSHTLQDPKLNLNSAVAMLKYLKFLYVKNESPFMFIRRRKRRCLELMIMCRHAIVKELCALYTQSEEAAFSLSEEFSSSNCSVSEFTEAMVETLYKNSYSLFDLLCEL